MVEIQQKSQIFNFQPANGHTLPYKIGEYILAGGDSHTHIVKSKALQYQWSHCSVGDSTIQDILDLAFSMEILSPEYFACLIHKDVLKLDLSRYVNQQLISDQILLQLQCKVC